MNLFQIQIIQDKEQANLHCKLIGNFNLNRYIDNKQILTKIHWLNQIII